MTEDAIQSVFNDIWNDNTDFFCVIKDNHSGEKLGYIGIKNSSKSIWEVAIELKEECRSKGYGPTAMSLFAKRIKEVAGKKQLQALVEVDNIASQRMLEKVGARLIDIRDISFKTEEESEKFEEENLQLITDRMRELAEYLEVEPRKLLSHVLEYAIFC